MRNKLTRDERLILQEAARIKARMNESRHRQSDADYYYDRYNDPRYGRGRDYSRRYADDYRANDEYPMPRERVDSRVVDVALSELSAAGLPSRGDIGSEHLEILGVSRDRIGYDLKNFLSNQEYEWFAGFYERLKAFQ